MSLTVPIVLLGILLLAATTYIAVRGELRTDDPWAKFAADHGLEFEPVSEKGGGSVLRGTYRGRAVELRDISKSSPERGVGGSAVVRCDVAVDLPPQYRLVGTDTERRGPIGSGADRRAISAEHFGLDESISVSTGAAAPEGGELSEGEAQRFAELVEAQPRLAVEAGRLVYWDSRRPGNRRAVRRLLDRMVDSAQHVEGA